MALIPGQAIGSGVLILKSTGGNIRFPGFGDSEVNHDINDIVLPKGNWSFYDGHVALSGAITGTLGWQITDYGMFAALTGGTSSTGAATGISWAKGEASMVPTAPGPYTYPLVNAAAAIGASLVTGSIYLTATGQRLTRVVGVPGAGEFAEAAGTVTFNAAQADAYFKIEEYAYTNATGSQVLIDPEDSPTVSGGYLAFDFVSDIDGTIKQWTYEFTKLRWIGGFKIGAPRAGFQSLSRDFALDNTISGDIKVHIG